MAKVSIVADVGPGCMVTTGSDSLTKVGVREGMESGPQVLCRELMVQERCAIEVWRQPFKGCGNLLAQRLTAFVLSGHPGTTAGVAPLRCESHEGRMVPSRK